MVLQILAESHSLIYDIDKRLKSCLAKWQSFISTETTNKLLSSFKDIPNTVGQIKIEIETALLTPRYTNEDIKIGYSFWLDKETKSLYYVCCVNMEIEEMTIEPYHLLLAKDVPRAEFDIWNKLIQNLDYFSFVSYDMLSFLGNNSYLISHTNSDGVYCYQSKPRFTHAKSQPPPSLRNKRITKTPNTIARRISNSFYYANLMERDKTSPPKVINRSPNPKNIDIISELTSKLREISLTHTPASNSPPCPVLDPNHVSCSP